MNVLLILSCISVTHASQRRFFRQHGPHFDYFHKLPGTEIRLPGEGNLVFRAAKLPESNDAAFPPSQTRLPPLPRPLVVGGVELLPAWLRDLRSYELQGGEIGLPLRDPSTIDDFPSPPEPQGLQGIDSDGDAEIPSGVELLNAGNDTDSILVDDIPEPVEVALQQEERPVPALDKLRLIEEIPLEDELAMSEEKPIMVIQDELAVSEEEPELAMSEEEVIFYDGRGTKEINENGGLIGPSIDEELDDIDEMRPNFGQGQAQAFSRKTKALVFRCFMNNLSMSLKECMRHVVDIYNLQKLQRIMRITKQEAQSYARVRDTWIEMEKENTEKKKK